MRKFLICFLLGVLCISLCGCENNLNNNSSNDVLEKTTQEMMDEIIEKNNYIIVDVRTKEEYNEGHIVGAINIPYDEIDEDCDLDIGKTILVYCKSGKKSSIAYDTLKKLGYDTLDLGAYDSINLEKE